MFSPDDLDALLSNSTPDAQDGVALNPALRDTVLARTTRVIQNRRRLKRLGAVAALAGCYLAGVLTMSVWRASAQLPRDSASSGDLAAQVQPKSETLTNRPLIRPEDDGVIPGSAAQTTVAKLSPYDRLRRTGDRQLEDENDIVAAARTYRRALKLAAPTERDVFPDKDTWLLMAMKNDQTNHFAEDMR